MGWKKVDDDKLMEMVGQKISQAEIARRMGVNPSSITKALKKLRKSARRVVPLEKGHRYEQVHFKLWSEFMEGFSSTTRFRLALERYIYEGDRTTFAAMQRKTQSKSVESGGESEGKGKKKYEEKIEHFDFMRDPKDLLAKVLQLHEEQVMDAIDIAKEIISVEHLISFLNDMIRLMAKVDPMVRHEIEETLKRHELIRSLITFDPGVETDMRDQTGGTPPS